MTRCVTSLSAATPCSVVRNVLCTILYFLLLCLPHHALSEDKTLRVLTWSGFETYLPRDGYPIKAEQDYLAHFAEKQGMAVEFIQVTSFNDLIPELLAGNGDVIAANMTITHARSKQIRFTTPVTSTVEYLLHGPDAKKLKNGGDLNGRTVSVQKGTSFWLTAHGLKKAYPELAIKELEPGLQTDDIMDMLVSGEIDLTIEDKNTYEAISEYREDIVRSLQASSRQKIAWAVRPNNEELLRKLNRYIELEIASKVDAPAAKNRWEQIKQDRMIRFVMRNNFSSYFIWRGHLMGFNYELARDFAKQHNLRYQIVVAPDNAAMLEYIAEGKADVALGFLTPFDARERMGIAFSRPYHYASEILVARSGDNIESIADLDKRRIFVRGSSSYWHTLTELRREHPVFYMQMAPETLETEELIAGVADETYDLTVADSHILDLELTWRDDIQGAMSLGEPRGQSWAVHQSNTQLLNTINSYIKQSYRGLFYNVTYDKYFRSNRHIDKHRTDYKDLKYEGRLSPYDDYVKKYAEQYDFDWRLLVAQMHQESKFDPGARSWSGAGGLFQVMPRTAKELGLTDLEDPETGVHAGVKYLDWVRDRMKYSNVHDDQLIWFTLAAYNAGAGHVRDAIRLAREKGWRDDVWFDNVEKAMLLLSEREYAAKARHGYVRGHEPVDYVRTIRHRYNAYVHVTE